jgi:hypothetical protein
MELTVRLMSDDVHKITLQTQRPKGSFPGRTEIGFYVFTEGSVILTDEQGRPIGGDGTKKFIGLDGHHRNVGLHVAETADSLNSKVEIV